MDPATPRQPLAGVRVIDCGTVYAAPITAMLLGDFGADVIKVEHPRGDPARTHGWNVDGHGLWWKVISRNKRCVTLNMGTPEGQGHCCIEPGGADEAWRGGGSPQLENAERDPNHSIGAIVCRDSVAEWRQPEVASHGRCKRLRTQAPV